MVPPIRRFTIRKGLFFACVAVFLIGGFFFLWAASLEMPDLSVVKERKVEQSTKIYDRTGDVLLYDLHKEARRTVVPIDEMSQALRNATVAIEDSSFYKHGGIRITSIIRAILANFMVGLGLYDGYTQGGSTITQQVIKRSLLTADKTLGRKLKEWVLALKLERISPKEKILELYLNEAAYGGSIYGAEEASNTYFGKKAKDVTLPEAAYLAAMLQAPTFYSPYGNHLDALEARKNLVLLKMRENGFITQAQYDEALTTEVSFKPPRESNIEAPHFVFYVRELLEEKYGQRALEESGWRIITTLDVELERKAEEIVKARALENEEKFNASNAAIVAVDPRTGDILTMAGSRDYFDENIQGNFNIALASRQPGSAFKPFVYAAAFSQGYTPDTVVFDVRTQFSTACDAGNLTSEGECYSPENYDHVFRGPVSLRNALAQSINIPAVKTLYLVGIQNALRLAKSLGITTLTTPDRYGLTLVLGGGEVRLLDMTSAYGVFAGQGVRYEPRAVLRIEDPSGKTIEETTPRGSQVLPQEVAMQINDVLSDNAARSPAFGENSYLYFPGRDVAAKTGTTNDYRDAWIIGYTPSIAAGAWAGNNDNSPMEKKVAGFIVAPLWHEFMEEALRHYESAPFPRAEVATEDLKPILKGQWNTGGEIHSILHFVERTDPLGPPPIDPTRDPQYRLWEPQVRAWALGAGYSSGPVPQSPYSFSFPRQGSVLKKSAPYLFSVSIPQGKKISRIDYFLNGTALGSAQNSPYSLAVTAQDVQGLTPVSRVRANVYEEGGSKNVTEVEVSFVE